MATPEQFPSEFGQAAFALDTDMKRFERLGQELESLNFQSDKGTDRGSELLTELSNCRNQLQTSMQEMVRTLEQARSRNEKTEQVIALCTQNWLQRQNEVDRLTARFKILGESVHHLNAMVSEIRKTANEEMSSEEKDNLRNQLTKALEPLTILVEDAKNLVQEARTANMKNLERNADGLRQTLQSAKNRLNLIANPVAMDTTQPSLHH